MKKIYGLTHRDDGTPIVRQVTTTKVGIGLPQGKMIHVYINQAGKWIVRVGKDQNIECNDKDDARKMYRSKMATAPQRERPERTQYFTFTRVSADGSYQPDFDAIELHGPTPTEVPIIFFRDDPFDCEYAYFTTLEKKCWGDGKTATRIVGLATSPEQKAAAERAKVAGERYYTVDQCWLGGCPFAKPGPDEDKSPCRPHGRLSFQLTRAPKLGTTAYFDTTGRRSISQIFSCLQSFREFTGRGNPDQGFVAGIPLWLTVRPYRQPYQYKGQKKTSIQYGVSVEFRGEGLPPEHLVQHFISAAVDYRLNAAAPLKQLSAAPADVSAPIAGHEDSDVIDVPSLPEEHEEIIVPEEPASIAGEFYPEVEGDEDGLLFPPEPEVQMPSRTQGAVPATGLSESTRKAIESRIERCRERGMSGLEIEELIDGAAGVRQLAEVQEGDAARLIAVLDGAIQPTKKRGK